MDTTEEEVVTPEVTEEAAPETMSDESVAEAEAETPATDEEVA